MAQPPEPTATKGEVRELLLQLSKVAPTTDTEQASIDEHSAHCGRTSRRMATLGVSICSWIAGRRSMPARPGWRGRSR
jgi:hypothetical protein